MTESRTLDTAKIRAVAAEVEDIISAIQIKGKALQACYDRLHDEMYLADPEKDKSFDKFLLELARAKLALENLWNARYQAKVMQSYGLTIGVPAESTPQRQSLLPPVGAPLGAPAIQAGLALQ